MALTDLTKYTSGQGPIDDLPPYGFAITKSDTTTYNPGVRVYSGGGGNVACVAWSDDSNTTLTVPLVAGGMVPFKVKSVLAATTATGLFGTV